MAQKALRVGFPVRHFGRTSTTQKLKAVQGRFAYRTIALLLEISILLYLLELYVKYHWRVMDPNTRRNHFAIRRIVSPYTRNSKSTGCMRTFYISNYCSTIGDVYFQC